jgi:hypothetical protein
MSEDEKATNEKFTISGDDLVEKIKQLTIGAPAAAAIIMAAPVLAAIGAFAALATECTLEVERVEESKSA